MIPKLNVTITISVEAAGELREILRPYMILGGDSGPGFWYYRNLFKDLFEDLRDLPPINARMEEPMAFYGSSGS